MKMYKNCWQFLAVIFSSSILIDGGCNTYVEPDNNNNILDTDTGVQLIMTTQNYMFNCCGVFSSLSFHPKNTGYIQFQAWRPLVTNVYMLIGEYRYYVPKKDETYTVEISDEIIVQYGDQLGWYTEGQEIIPYSTGSAETDDIIRLVGSEDVTVRYNHTVTNIYIHDRTYAYRVYATDSTTPYFTNIPATIEVYDHVASGTLLYEVEYTDDNVNDRDSLTIVRDRLWPSGSNIDLDVTTGQVTTSGSLNAGTTIELSVKVTDQCGKSKTSKLKIKVLNHAPVIANLPASVDIEEVTANETWLHNISVSDASGDDVTCSIASTSPSNAPFLVKYVSGTNVSAIYSKARPSFDFDKVTEYDINVECSDTKDQDTEVFKVYLIRNDPPVLTNLPAFTTVWTNTSVGTVLFTASATDPENDPMRFYISSCGTCPFEMPDSGDLMLKTSLIGTTEYSKDLYIRVYDVSSYSDQKKLTVIYKDVNNGPVLENLPFTVILREDVAVGTEVFSLIVTEVDPDDTIQYQVSYNPASAGTTFSFDATSKQITLVKELDFESGVTNFQLSFTVDDTKTTDGPKKLTVNVINVNEAPVFQKTKYYINNIERPKGYALTSPNFVVTDNDVGDTIEYSFAGGDDSSRFIMDSSTGDLTFAVTYDVDNGLMPSFMTFIVQAKDTGGMTGTTTLEVSISDGWDDNVIDFPEVAYEFNVECDLKQLSTISYVTANDPDDGIYGQVVYAAVASDASSYFGIGADDGELYVARSLTAFCNYTLLPFQVEASNNGNNTVTVGVYVMVTPATEDPGMFDNPSTVAWFTILMILGAAIVILIVVAFYRLCRYGYIFTQDSLIERFRKYMDTRKAEAEIRKAEAEIRKAEAKARKAEAKNKKEKVIEMEPIKKKPTMELPKSNRKPVVEKPKVKKPGIFSRLLNAMANFNLWNNFNSAKVGNTDKRLRKENRRKAPQPTSKNKQWLAWGKRSQWEDGI